MPKDAFSCDPCFLKDLFARPKLLSDVNKAADSCIAQVKKCFFVVVCLFFVTLVCFALLMSQCFFFFFVFYCTLYLIVTVV